MFDARIRDHARWNPRALAVITPRERVTYARFDSDIDRFGTALAALGVHPGRGVVSLRLASPYLICVATAALARLGVASAPRDDDAADLHLVDGQPASTDDPRMLRLSPAWVTEALAAPHTPLPRLPADPGRVVRVNLSSGTTRVPRRVALTAARIDGANTAQLCSFAAGRLGTWLAIPGPDTAAGFVLPVSAWSVGAAYAGGLPLETLAEWLEVLEPGLVCATPLQLRQLLAFLPPGYRPQPRWRFWTGGAAAPPALIQQVRLRITPDVWINYGSTEASLNSVGPAFGEGDVPGQVGHPFTGCEIEVLGPDGVPVPAGDTGEIRIRSDRMSTGYIDDPDATARRFRDGWFHPGDLGRYLPDGRLVIEGRVDDRMNLAGGFKFMPERIEVPALACPGVTDCAAFAVPDPQGFDQCWLAVAAAPGFDRETLAAHLANYPGLPPPRFAWVDEVPRNAMGKVERAKLRDAVLAALGGTPA